MKKIFTIVLILCCFITADSKSISSCDSADDLLYIITLKLCELDKNISQQEEISVYVLGPEKIAKGFEGIIGHKAGNAVLKEVNSGKTIPEEKYTVIFVSTESEKTIEEAIEYANKNKVLSVTNCPDLVSKGIAFGISFEKEKPKILINLSAARQEGLNLSSDVLQLDNIIMELKSK